MSPKRSFSTGVVMAIIAAGATAQDLVVKIGHVAPTSGAIAHLGKDNENGARMAIADLNARGVVIGGKKVKLELIAEDDGGDPKQGAAAAQKLVDSKVSGVIGHLNSGTSIPASSIYCAAGIPQISPSATNPTLTRQGFKTTFRIAPDDLGLASRLGTYAVKELKGHKVAIVDDRTPYGQRSADAFEASVRRAGGNIVGREFTSATATSFSSIGSSLRNRRPEIIFFGGMSAIAGPLLQEIKQQRIGVKYFLGGDGICSADLPMLAAGATSDVQVLCAEAGGVPSANKNGMNEFAATYKRRFNSDVQLYAPYTYDAVNVLVAAMVKAGSSDPARYLAELAKMEGYKGVTGTISFDKKGDIKSGAIALYTFNKTGKQELVAVLDAPSVEGAASTYSRGSCSNGSSGGPAQQMPRPKPAPRTLFDLARNDLGSHRAQADASGSPAVVAQVTATANTQSTNQTPNTESSNTSAGRRQQLADVSAWGRGSRALACIEALAELRAVGRAEDYESLKVSNAPNPSAKRQLDAERSFASTCLTTPDPRLASRVGVIRTAQGIRCTVTLISGDTAITARHCLFSQPDFDPFQGALANSRTSVNALKDWTIEFGELGQTFKSPIKDVLVLNLSGWQRIAIQAGDVDSYPSVSFFTLDLVQSDFALLTLAKSAPGVPSQLPPTSPAKLGDKIFMVSYYPGFNLVPQIVDTGLRQQNAGLCQVLEINDRCFVHGCSTNSSASGAAMFVERVKATGEPELRLIGIHSSGKIPDTNTRCPAKSEFANIFNIGISVRSTELATAR